MTSPLPPFQSSALPSQEYRTGPKLDVQALDRLAGIDRAGTEDPTWRGWCVGLASVAFLALSTPHIEMYLSGSNLTVNLLPVGPMILVALFLLIHTLLYKYSGRMALNQPDLTLIACMMMVCASIPGYGFVTYLTGVLAGAGHFATPENRWEEYITPYQPAWMVPHDPQDPDSLEPRPVEWFMTGLPPGRSIPWAAWLIPYGYWALMALSIFGMMFAVCSVLRKQWADRERLPFPLAQVPLEMLEGLPGTAERKRPFFQDSTALAGMGLPFLLHSWNSMITYRPNWPDIPLKFKNLHGKYLTEPPWSALGPIDINIFPAVIGLTYLLSLEVSFSLWFFYLLSKACAFVAVRMGLGASHADFYKVGTHKGFMVDQGGGALIAMVLFGLWMSRTHLADVFTRALGLRKSENEESEGLSARSALVLFTLCFMGAVLWLIFAGFGVGIALLTIVTLVIILTGVTRLACEGGLFYVQSDISPADILNIVFTPLGLGPHTVVPLGMWSRVFTFDWGRTSPMPGMMHSLKLSSDLRLRKGPLVAGIALSLVLAMGLGFYSFLRTAFTNPGGAVALEGGASWTMETLPDTDFKAAADKVSKILAYEKKFDEYCAKLIVDKGWCAPAAAKEHQAETERLRLKGARIFLYQTLLEKELLTSGQVSELLAQQEIVPKKELPEVAKANWVRVLWLGVGAFLMALFMFLRTHVFWWPHPIGYVVWMHAEPMARLWFSILVGWALKWAVTQYGGYRIYLLLRRFFIGLVIGEVGAAGFWIAVAWSQGKIGAYKIGVE